MGLTYFAFNPHLIEWTIGIYATGVSTSELRSDFGLGANNFSGAWIGNTFNDPSAPSTVVGSFLVRQAVPEASSLLMVGLVMALATTAKRIARTTMPNA